MLGLLLVVAATVVVAWGVLGLASSSVDVIGALTVFAGSAVTLGFFLAPIVTAISDPLDPRRFRVFALPSRPLAATLVLASLLSLPLFALIVLVVCAGIVWAEAGVSILALVTAGVLGVLTCVLLARLAHGLAAMMFRERRSRELSGLLLVLIVVVVVPVGVFLASLDWNGAVPGALAEAVGVISFTPLGAAWAFPALLAAGEGTAWLALAVSIVTVAALGYAWLALVHRQLTTIDRPLTTRERGGLGWFSVVPGTPAGAVAARSLVYWGRDRRYLVNLLVIPFAALVTMVPLLVAGVPLNVAVLVPVLFAALFFGWLPHNDLAYDSTAIWMHVASGLRGLPDRVGRLVPIVLIAVPVLAIAVPVSVALHGRWAIAPAIVGACLSLFLSGLGLSSISSVAAPYPVTSPGESPFQQPQRTGSSGAVPQAVVMIGALVLSAPPLWWTWLSLTSSVDAAELAFWSGLGMGVFILFVGVMTGSAVFNRRSRRIMEFAAAT
ncbi:hypothetical protein GCM10009808_04540 [Microbacterium sediminicola]|uniref:ABC-2 type transport system permease protein n=1 Tax=Microbacterium sediminicola TaxID=415210 RepID=A0ABP4TN09_9MICO